MNLSLINLISKRSQKYFWEKFRKKSTRFRRLPNGIENIFIVKEAFVKSLFGFNNRVRFFVGQLKRKGCRRCTYDDKMRCVGNKRQLLIFGIIWIFYRIIIMNFEEWPNGEFRILLFVFQIMLYKNRNFQKLIQLGCRNQV